jgi:hypothetical protein
VVSRFIAHRDETGEQITSPGVRVGYPGKMISASVRAGCTAMAWKTGDPVRRPGVHALRDTRAFQTNPNVDCIDICQLIAGSVIVIVKYCDLSSG